MNTEEFSSIAIGFNKTSEIEKGEDLYYRCTDCGSVIPSLPNDNIGCSCGNIFIDKDYWRLIVTDLSKIEVVKKI